MIVTNHEIKSFHYYYLLYHHQFQYFVAIYIKYNESVFIKTRSGLYEYMSNANRVTETFKEVKINFHTKKCNFHHSNLADYCYVWLWDHRKNKLQVYRKGAFYAHVMNVFPS